MYRTIAASLWTDPKVKKLPADGKLLFIYFITNPHTHVSGIYVLPAVIIQHETGLSKRSLDTLSHTLFRDGFCRFDPANDVIWVVKMMSYQGRGEKHDRSAASHIVEDLHNSFLCKQFLEVYPTVRQYVPKTFADTLSDTPSEVGPPDSRFPIPDPDSRSRIPNTDIREPLGQFANVSLSEKELGKLQAKFGEAGTQERIETLSEYMASKRAKYDSHYATILSWDRRKGKNHGSHQQNGTDGRSETQQSTGKSGYPTYTPKQ